MTSKELIDAFLNRTPCDYETGVLMAIESPEGPDSDPLVSVFVEDCELDIFRVDFDEDGFMTFQIENLRYIMMDPDDLRWLAGLSSKAKTLWRKLRKHYDIRSEQFRPTWKADPACCYAQPIVEGGAA